MLIPGSFDLLMKAGSGNVFHKSPELTPWRCVKWFPHASFYVWEETYTCDCPMKGVNWTIEV